MGKEHDEKLIDEDPNAELDDSMRIKLLEASAKSRLIILAIMATLCLILLAIVIAGFITMTMRISDLEAANVELHALHTEQEGTLEAISLQLAKFDSDYGSSLDSIKDLSLNGAEGKLAKVAKMLQQLSDMREKELATTRNGLLSLSRMVRGSSVWQDDYGNQYQDLLSKNRNLMEQIQDLRGVKKEEKPEPPGTLDF
ncbi:MAG: hypothetical protein H7A09_08210 [Oceanospirillaceae bacterium]|nr:hypothetical protein [Oceanospirillaceae bacterium]MCP5350169.1 hypothetical protein [Oceanospirillaceae bacterium]